MDAIRTQGLTKQFGNTHALDALDLAVSEGVIYGFLGPNGAGKTTTFRLLAGLVRATKGNATVLGCDISSQRLEVQNRIGYLPGEASLYETLTGEQSFGNASLN